MKIHKRLIPAIGVAVLMIGLASIALALVDSRSGAVGTLRVGPDLQSQVNQGAALASAPPLAFTRESPTHSTVTELRRAGARLSAGIPLPPGGSFERIRWDAAAAQGGDSEAGMQSVLEYQAACQWYEYSLANEAATDALAVIATIAQWPSMRESPTNKQVTATRIAAAFRDGDLALVRDHVATNCR